MSEFWRGIPELEGQLPPAVKATTNKEGRGSRWG